MSGTVTGMGRREYKYFLPLSRIAEFRRRLRGHAELDAFSGPTGRYVVDSLYYDAPDQRLYLANMHERLDRYKMRVRHYPETPGNRVFLEVKRRTGDIIRKLRTSSDYAHWTKVLQDPTSDAGLKVQCEGLRPAMRVRYTREAWNLTHHPYARCSVDTAICGLRQAEAHLEASTGWRPLGQDMAGASGQPSAVLELKFSGTAPLVFSQLVREMELERQAYGKYIRAVRLQGSPLGWVA